MTPELRTAIYSTVLDTCDPVELPSPWAFLDDQLDVVGPIADSEDLLDQLLDQYESEALTSAGVAVETDEDIELHDSLSSELFLPLRHQIDQECFEIVTSEGCLSGRSIPALSVSRDEQTCADSVSQDSRLFVTGSLWETGILRSLGLPAVTASGLTTADLQQIEQICRRFGLTANPFSSTSQVGESASPLLRYAANLREVQGNNQPCSRLILVAWSVLQCTQELPPRIDEVMQHFAHVSINLHRELSHVQVWQPPVADLSQLVWALELESRELVRAALLRSIANSTSSLADLVAELAPDPADSMDYQEACQNLLKELRGAIPGEEQGAEMQAARVQLAKVVDRKLIQPLLDEAEQSADPGNRVLKMQMAELSRLFFQRSSELMTQDGELPPRATERDIKTQLELAKTVASLRKQCGSE